MIRYYNFEQRSDKWYTYRQGRWTGSTAIDLLSGKDAPPESNGDYDNKYMQRGRILEPLAIETYEIKQQTKVLHYGFITNSKWPHAGYSPDGVDSKENVLLEVKCLGVQKHNSIIEGIIPIPTEYIAQIQFGLLISGLPKAKLLLYNPDADVVLHIMEILPDSEIQEFMVKRLEETRPKVKPSVVRARRKYVEQNPLKIKEQHHKYYLKTRGKKMEPQDEPIKHDWDDELSFS